MRLRSFRHAIDRKPPRVSAPGARRSSATASRGTGSADTAVVGTSCKGDAQVGTVGMVVPFPYRIRVASASSIMIIGNK
jgi:hypothetical protein